ncbi:MAG TPA: M4 family metallopeptidase [Kineosporiaceae bacterium]|nr:M4 family metallopeptidase [Kineosporiaceae bacterium]
MKTVFGLLGALVLASTTVVATGTNTSAAPAPPDPPNSALIKAANAALKAHPTSVRASAKDKYTVFSGKKDASGQGVVRYTRSYAGLRVYGGDLIIRTEKDGDYAGTSVGLAKPLTLSTTPKVTRAKAKAAAVKAFSGKVKSVGKPELFVDASTGLGKLSWETVISGWAKDGQTPSRLHVISNAVTGAKVGSYDEIETIAGTGKSLFMGTVGIDTTLSGSTYSMVDPVRGGGKTCDMKNTTSGTCTTFTDADNVWGTGSNSDRATAAVDAGFGAATTFDYFKNVHGRNGIFGTGAGVPSRVHYGSNYVNAFWDGAQMTYGDGSGNAAPLVALDVAGHEMSHGVTENVVPGGLTYAAEPGGLNEATSDIFGTMVEFYANSTADPGDYNIGEKININGDGTPLRYMYNPTLDGSSHGCWSSTTKGIDVHNSSGVANHFFFDLAEGTGATQYGTSPVCNSAPAVTGIGRQKAERIWFTALDQYFVSNTSYVNTATPSNSARAHTLSAAAALYGLCGTEYKAVQAAWTAVNVAGSDKCVAGNDFSLQLSSASVNVAPGKSATVTASTAVVNGTAETITFASSTTPAGVTVSFSPATVTAGQSTTITVSASSTASSATTGLTITGTTASNTHSAALSVTVASATGCSGANTTAAAIPDLGTVNSTIAIAGCANTTGSATSKVEVHITHTYSGDLVVSLLAPDGTVYTLQNRTGGSTDNIDQTYTVNLASEAPNGTWTLRVQDAASADTGTLSRWSLSL